MKEQWACLGRVLAGGTYRPTLVEYLVGMAHLPLSLGLHGLSGMELLPGAIAS